MNRKSIMAAIVALGALLALAPAAGASQIYGKGKITYIKYVGGTHADLWVMNDDGSHKRNLTPDSSGDEDSPAISPNGKRIAFIRYSASPGIWVISASGGNTHRVVKTSATTPSWAPNGKSILYRCSDGNICSVRLKTGAAHHITHGANAYSYPIYSPNMKRIAFSGLGDTSLDLFTVRPDGSHLRNLTHDDVVAQSSPSWSKGGKTIAASDDAVTFYSAKTGDPKGTSFPGFSAAYSPDGRHVAYNAFDGNDYEIYRRNSDGTHKHNLTDDDESDYIYD